MPRGGNGFVVNSTGNGDNQTGGASFRIIVDLADLDRSVVTSTPGQSGDPASPHYFPVAFTRERVVAESRLRIAPYWGRGMALPSASTPTSSTS